MRRIVFVACAVAVVLILAGCSRSSNRVVASTTDTVLSSLQKENETLKEENLRAKIVNVFSTKYSGMTLDSISRPVDRRLVWFYDDKNAYVCEAYVDESGNVLLTLPLQVAPRTQPTSTATPKTK